MDLRERLQAALETRYTIEHELGGGMACVFVATEHAHQRKVVIKMLPEPGSELAVERFKRELSLLARLQHPHVVPLLTSGDVEGRPWFVMPFVEGTSLRHRLAGGPLSILEAVRILRDVAKGLAYAHGQGIAHRDIKPDNVLLSGDAAVITDFGIAGLLFATRTSPAAALTREGMSVGTPGYMAPEQVAADPAWDEKVDVYALGCTAYEMLTGEPPFHGGSPQQVVAAHISVRPTPISRLRRGVPHRLATLVDQCLEKDPSRRPRSAQAVLAQLETVLMTLGAPPDRRALWQALGAYAAGCTLAVGASTTAEALVGLPNWVQPTMTVLLGLGLPAIVGTAWTHAAAWRAVAEPPFATQRGEMRLPSAMQFAALLRPRVTWRRTLLAGAAAMGALAAATLGYHLMWKMGVGPIGSLLGQGVIEDGERVIVAEFRGPPGDPMLGRVVTEAFRIDLSQSRQLTVMPAAVLDHALQRMRRPQGSRIDVATAREIAVREGVKAVLDGQVIELGDGYIVGAELHDARTGAVLATFSVDADRRSDLIRQIGVLVRKVRAKAGESLRDIRASPPLERVTSTSTEAVIRYTQALQHLERGGGDRDRGVALLEEAIALDSTFAMAHRKLAVELTNTGSSWVRAQAAIGRAYAHRDRLPAVERHMTVAAYFDMGPEPDSRKSIAAYEALLATDSTHAIAWNNLGMEHLLRRDYDKAERAFTMSVTMGPGVGGYMNLLWTQSILGRHEDARETARRMRRDLPDSPAPVWADASLLVLEGKHDSARAMLQGIVASREVDPSTKRRTHRYLATFARIRGQYRDAMRHDREFYGAASRQGSVTAAWAAAIAEARTFTVVGDRERARRILRGALVGLSTGGRSGLDVPHQELAEMCAELGLTAEARLVLAAFDSSRRVTRQRYDALNRQLILGYVAMAERRYEDALVAFNAAELGPCGRCLHPDRAAAHDLSGRRDSTIALLTEYTQWLNIADSETYAWFLAPAYRRLAELLEEIGDLERAATNYVRFVQLWENADAELQPQVADVRRRLERIRRAELH